MWRIAVYAREAPGRHGRANLDRQVDRLATEIARQPGWHHVAVYADQSLGRCSTRQGLCRLLADAPGHFDVVVVDGYGRISPNRRELTTVIGHLNAAGVRTVVLRPPAGHRLVKAVANFALADLIGEAAR